jgi:hypothetical protein
VKTLLIEHLGYCNLSTDVRLQFSRCFSDRNLLQIIQTNARIDGF